MSSCRCLLCLLLVVFLLWVRPGSVARSEELQTGSRPQIGLVLEGGGALGFAHVGVLKVLEAEQIPVHFIAGTSMGSIVGAGYASGRSIAELEKALSETDWDKLFREAAPRQMVRYRNKSGREAELFGDAKLGYYKGRFVTPTALVEGQFVELLFERLFGKSNPVTSFDDLPVPYRAVAADIVTGEAVVLDHGSVARAARASMSVPTFFSPVEIEQRLLVDGGIANNFPVNIALDWGVDVVIGVQFQNPLRTKEMLTGPLSISAQVLDLLLMQTSERGLKLLRPQDILIQPDISEYSSTSFKEATAIMKKGEEAARSLVDRLRKLAISEAEYAHYSARRTSLKTFAPQLEYVKVEGVSSYRAERIKKVLSGVVGKPLNRDEVEQGLERIFQSGEYQRLNYEIVEEGGKNALLVQARTKEWLKNYFRMGFSLEDDFDGGSAYSLAVSMRFNELNSWGAYADLQGEIGRSGRLFAELYQPLGEGGRLFVAPEIAFDRIPLTVREDGEEAARYERKSAVMGFKAGISFGRFGEMHSGWFRGSGRLERDIGEETLPEFDYDLGEVVSTLILDQFDNPDFPTSGYRLDISHTVGRDFFGSSDDFEQARIMAGLPLTMGRTTLLLGGEFGYSSANLPVERSYSLGGMFDISGFEQRSLTADNYQVGRAVLFYRFLDAPSSLLTFGGYLGATLEVASLQSDVEAIGDSSGIVAGSIFVGADTPLVPIYLAFGSSDESERALYLNLGRLNARRR